MDEGMEGLTLSKEEVLVMCEALYVIAFFGAAVVQGRGW